MKIGVIVQARTGSTRLPNKILYELPYGSGKSILENVVNRLKIVKSINSIIIATTTDPNDNKILEMAKNLGVQSFQGEIHDVLSRYYHAAENFKLDVIIRVTSDCPCIDPELIDKLITLYFSGQYDYARIDNEIFPRGVDAEIFNFNTLEKAYQNAEKSYDREHVTPYMYTNSEFSVIKLKPEKSSIILKRPPIRITVDTIFDYILLCGIFDFLVDKKTYTLMDIYAIYEEHPWLNSINDFIQQKGKLLAIEEELPKARSVLTSHNFLSSAKILNYFIENKQDRKEFMKKIKQD